MTISGNCPVFLCLFIDLSGHVHWTVRWTNCPVGKWARKGPDNDRKMTGKWQKNSPENLDSGNGVVQSCPAGLRLDNVGECKALNQSLWCQITPERSKSSQMHQNMHQEQYLHKWTQTETDTQWHSCRKRLMIPRNDMRSTIENYWE